MAYRAGDTITMRSVLTSHRDAVLDQELGGFQDLDATCPGSILPSNRDRIVRHRRSAHTQSAVPN